MLFYIGSDIHGSLPYAKRFIEKALEDKADRIILLGDLYYNGARNDPPEGYAPKEVVKLLNSVSDRILAVKGNCESEVDQMVSDFLIAESLSLFAFGKAMTCVHGHHFSFDNLPKNPGDVFFQGHSHISRLEKKGELILANPGSLSLPKDGRRSYMTMDEKGIALRDLLDGNLVSSLVF